MTTRLAPFNSHGRWTWVRGGPESSPAMIMTRSRPVRSSCGWCRLGYQRAAPGRVYDYWLGGKDNFAADRQVAEEILQVMPVMVQIARSCRLFLSTVVHYLAADLGIRQFLDIGTGLPTADNTHEVAQRAAPEARIVYVDNDHCNSGCAH
jgi:hypothetical protein